MKAVWIAKVLILLRGGRGDGESDVVSVQYLDVTALLSVMEYDLRCICVGCSTPDKILHKGLG